MAGYKESFKKLGYELISVRQDWSAINDYGVCISLWNAEMLKDGDTQVYDTRVGAEDIKKWGNKAGANRRLEHLKFAMDRFDGWVDVVVRKGGPKDDNALSYAWVPEERKGAKWRVVFFEPDTGHFRAELKQLDEGQE